MKKKKAIINLSDIISIVISEKLYAKIWRSSSPDVKNKSLFRLKNGTNFTLVL